MGRTCIAYGVGALALRMWCRNGMTKLNYIGTAGQGSLEPLGTSHRWVTPGKDPLPPPACVGGLHTARGGSGNKRPEDLCGCQLQPRWKCSGRIFRSLHLIKFCICLYVLQFTELFIYIFFVYFESFLNLFFP